MNAPSQNRKAVQKTYITQGQHAISQGENNVIATLLGSCVSACLWDPVCAVGGMNHVLFIDDSSNASEVFGHGVNGMELLINGLVQRGVNRRNLQAKVFGGASMIAGLSDAGARNGEFVLQFLEAEGIAHVGGDLGGRSARRLEFWPSTGRARARLVNEQVPTIKPKPVQESDIELF